MELGQDLGPPLLLEERPDHDAMRRLVERFGGEKALGEVARPHEVPAREDGGGQLAEGAEVVLVVLDAQGLHPLETDVVEEITAHEIERAPELLLGGMGLLQVFVLSPPLPDGT